MKHPIVKISENAYSTKTGNTSLTLQKAKACDGWYVQADNPAVRAYRTLGVKYFHNLNDVESHYKAFRGIQQLLSI